MSMDIFDRIKNGVKAQNTTIEALLMTAFNGEVSRDVYNGWKRRNVYPRADQAVVIAKVLDTTVEYLVTGENSTAWKPPQRYADIVNDLDILDEKDLESVRILTSGLSQKSMDKKKSQKAI